MIDELITIEVASPAGLGEVLGILSQAELPHDGVAEDLAGFLVARSGGGQIVGCIGLERYGKLGLLRSAAVLPEYRGQRIGNRLVRELLHRAAHDGITEVALLTTTAKDYFAKQFGFQEAKRARYEKRLVDSLEWNLPRCSSAVLMTRKLTPDTDIFS
jgi:N-acetylglutamate synthase-like GNAT family acetyltransferase